MTILRRPTLTVAIGLSLALLAGAEHALAAAPPGQYTLATATVTDRRTGLVWQRAPDMTRRTPANATAYCQGLGDSWRLPTIRELLTIVDVTTTTSPTIDTTAFPQTGSQQYWTSTAYADPRMANAVWAVDFNTGVPNGVTTSTTTLLVRCVR